MIHVRYDLEFGLMTYSTVMHDIAPTVFKELLEAFASAEELIQDDLMYTHDIIGD
jgi:hypothetical protein